MARVSEWKKVWVRANEEEWSVAASARENGRQSSVHCLDGSFFGTLDPQKIECEVETTESQLNHAAAEVILCWILDTTRPEALVEYLEKRKERRKGRQRLLGRQKPAPESCGCGTASSSPSPSVLTWPRNAGIKTLWMI